MVFESIVADLLNRVLGDYFTNFDPKNLSIGLWGGDVVLKDLFLKTSALDDVGLPFKVVVGTLGTLTAKIPWKSLYTSPVELHLKDLHLLVVPAHSVAYNEESEDKAAQDAKKKELARLDEIRKKELERKKGAQASTADSDTFAEKLTSQVIKNVQIRIESIHIRYEDAVTKPNAPFGFGVCLKSLNVQTTDGNWNPMIIAETVQTFHKLASLAGLSLYWNSNTTILSTHQDRPAEILSKMKEMVLEDRLLTHVLGPIESSAKIELTPSPEKGSHPFSVPKAIVDVVMNELALGLTNKQFQDITQLADAMDSMSRAGQYRKYRPQNITVHKGYYKEWWKFAYSCIVEEDIRRRRLNWDWEHMKQHRKLVKIYHKAYYTKLTTPASKKLSPEVEAQLHTCEKFLDIFNIALVRKQVEVKVDRLPPPVEEPTGWFSSWFGGGTKQDAKTDQGLVDIRNRFMEALTQEEKDKLYHAIEYEKDAGPIDFPKEYVEYNLNFNLLKLSCSVKDEDTKVKITEMVIADVRTLVSTRPVKNCLKLELNMGNMEMMGTNALGEMPKLVTTKRVGKSHHLLEVLFETSPLDSSVDQRIIVSAQPLEITYHAATIIELVKCFTLPPDIQLAKLQATAQASFNEWKEQSTAGIQYMIDTRGAIELVVDVFAPYLLIPSGGVLTNSNQSVLILDLGQIHVASKPREKVEQPKVSGQTTEEYRQAVLEKSYDSFVVTLKDFQVLLTLPEENLKVVLEKEVFSKTRTMAVHLIRSEELKVQLDQCFVKDDVRLPKMKVSANLPLLDIDVAENRLLELVQLLVKLPLPQNDAVESDPTSITFGGTTDSLANDPSLAQANAITHITYTDVKKKSDPEEAVQFTNMVVFFNLESIRLKVNRAIGLSKTLSTPLIQFELSHIRVKYTDKTFGSGIDLDVGGLTLASLNHRMPDLTGPLYLLKTPMTEGANTYLLKVHMFSITPDCPEKYMTDVKQLIKVDVSSMDIILHLEAIQSILSLVDDTTESFNKALESVPKADIETISTRSSTSTSKRDDEKVRRQVSKLEATRKLVAKKHVNKKDILLQLDARLDSLTVQMSTEKKNIVKVILAKLDVSFVQRPHKQLISMNLTELKILNLDKVSFYKNILTVEDDKVVHVHVTMYNDVPKCNESIEVNKHDMKVKVKTGCAKVVYLSAFVNEIMDFVDKFQAAKDAVADASAAAAGVAMENAEQLYASSSRIALDIELLAPKVIVPRNGNSPSGVLADFGQLSIQNIFKTVHPKDMANLVIVDEMRVQLSKMKMSRILMEPMKQGIIAEVLMLDPLTATVNVQRNLSAEWYNEIPNIEVVGKLEHVFLRASNEDYDILMACLNENVAAPAPQAAAAPEKATKQRRPSVSRRNSSSRSSRKSSESALDAVPKKSVASTISKGQGKDYCTLKLDIVIVKTGFVMYEGTLKTDQSGLVQRKQNEAFADFSIQGISLGLSMWTNNNMNCDIIVQDMNLEDCRPGKREIKHLIQRKLRGGSTIIENSAIAKVTHRTDAAGKKGTTTNIETTSLTLVLCLDYLLKIATFFTTTSDKKPKIETQQAGATVPIPIAGDNVGSGDASKGTNRAIDTIPEEEEHPEEPVTADEELLPTNMYLTMGETEVILVETMETVDTNALLLNCEVSMKMSALGTKSNMMGAVNRMTLHTCNYNPEKRDQTLAEVISPMSITFIMNVSEDNGTLIDINISDIFIRLTAGTLELLIKISSSIAANQEGAASGNQAADDYSDLWKVRKNNECEYWFLKQETTLEVGQDALNAVEERAVKLFEVAEDLVVKERLVLESGCIVLTFETGYGSNTTPILLVETDLDMQLFDWSKKLQFAGRLKLEAAYYNAVYGMWEFLVEPVETRHHGKVAHQPWELLFEYTTVDCVTTAADGDGPESSDNPTFMAISLLSHDVLEVTITKTALDVINVLSKDFSEASKMLVSQRDVITSPYTIVNECGADIELDLTNSAFILVRKGLNYEKAHLKTGTTLSLSLTQSYDMTKHHTSILKEQEGKEERLLKVLIPEYQFFEEVPVNRAEKRYYDLNKKTEWGSSYGLICDVTVKECTKVVTIRGVVQVQNELNVPVDVYYMDNSGNNLVLVGTAEKDKPFNAPLVAVYTKSCELFFAPQGYSVSTTPYIWTSLLEKLHGVSYLTSRPRNPPAGHSSDFQIKVIGQVKQALWKGTNRKTIASQYCNITLKPPLILDNLLPVELGYFISGTSQLITTEKGTCVQITDIEVQKKEFEIKLKIPNYENETWTSVIKINKGTSELFTRQFVSDKTGKSFSLGIHKEIADEIMVLHIYCPFWMINRTGLDLKYKGEDKESPIVNHAGTREEPVLFSFREKAFFAKKKAVVSLDGKTEWSEKFSLDVAGSCGSVTCSSPSSNYQVGVEIVLTSWGLTKQIIFSPRFYLINHCETSVLLFEKEGTSKEIKIEPKACIAFWPLSKVSEAIVCFEDEPKGRSKSFSYEQVHSTLLELPNRYGGINVDIHVTEVSTVITFSNFIPGQAPVLLINATSDSPIEISEKGVDATKILAPNTSQVVTWMDPMGKRLLTWSPETKGKKNIYTDKLHSDGTGTYKFINSANDEKEYYWVCFLDNLQRVLLFTTDAMLCAYLQSARDIELPTADYTIMLHGIGLSLVDNEKCKELMYLRIASSEIAWETSKPGKKQRYKPLPPKDSQVIEAAYQNYLNSKAIATNEHVKSHLNLDIGMEVDFLDLKVLKPKPMDLRRVFQTGLWLHYKQFPHSSQIHAKLNRIQIDNQMDDCIFRIVLAPIPPPKSVSKGSDLPKPFAEVSIMQRMTAHSSIIQYKYFKVLVQEFHVKVDINFVNALVDLFTNQADKKVEHMVEYFNKDYKEACKSVKEFLDSHNTSQGQKHFYDFLHFSPLKIHVSFSMGGATQLSNNFLNLLLQSVGVTLTEIQDVVFKLACLELQHMFLSGDQLYAEAYSHYSSQAIKQLYVLVLGLDVIGNPYGLVMGVTEGVEAFFYEPFQGAIQGPGEFAEGLVLGVRSLVGSTVGGAAGALGKITGTLGKGLAALTMDEDYQRKRRENLSKRNDVASGMAQSGKGLVMGFVDGVTGVFTKPVKGARDEGVGGFFKGLGKGAIGLVARPTAGVVDFTSGTFDAVKRVTSNTDEVRRMRPPRHIPKDSVIQPYVCHEAEGMQLLHELEKGKYIATDTYIAHALVNPHGVYVLLLTNKRVMYLKKEEFFGGWTTVWSRVWDELNGSPVVVEKGLRFHLKERKKKKKFGGLSGTHKAKELFVPLYSAEVCTWMLSKIEAAMKTEVLDVSPSLVSSAASASNFVATAANNSSSAKNGKKSP